MKKKFTKNGFDVIEDTEKKRPIQKHFSASFSPSTQEKDSIFRENYIQRTSSRKTDSKLSTYYERRDVEKKTDSKNIPPSSF